MWNVKRGREGKATAGAQGQVQGVQREWLDVAMEQGCNCGFSDAWRCAKKQGLKVLSCPCRCHQYIAAPPADVSSQAGQAVTRMEDGGAMGPHYVAPSAGSGQEGRPPRTVGCTASADCIHECPANEPEARLDEFKTTVIAMLDPELTGEQKKAYIAARGKELREMAALLPPASKPSAAMNEISLVKLVLSAHQTAYARFHCTEKRGVIESHGMAIGYASVELAKALRGEK